MKATAPGSRNVDAKNSQKAQDDIQDKENTDATEYQDRDPRYSKCIFPVSWSIQIVIELFSLILNLLIEINLIHGEL